MRHKRVTVHQVDRLLTELITCLHILNDRDRQAAADITIEVFHVTRERIINCFSSIPSCSDFGISKIFRQNETCIQCSVNIFLAAGWFATVGQ